MYVSTSIPWAFLIAQLVKICLQYRRLRSNSWVGKIRWRKDRLPTPVFLDFPCGSVGKESNCNAGDYFWGLQNHAGDDCSHEIKRCLLFG